MVPTDLRYTNDHEWVRVDGEEATIGITAYAADQLGDIVFVELPEAGRSLSQFAAFGVVESVKAVSDLFAPLTGEVTGANDALTGSPELVMLRGNVLVDSGELLAEPGVGEFVERAAFGQELLPAAAR